MTLVEKVATVISLREDHDWQDRLDVAQAAIETVLREQRDYADELLTAYRKKWAESLYLGPAEKTPTEIEELVLGFIKDFCIEHGIDQPKIEIDK